MHLAAINGTKQIQLKVAQAQSQLIYCQIRFLGFDKIVALLIDKGYKHQIHSKTGAGDTPLHWAVWNGYENIVNKLIQAGSDVNIANNANNTPLQWAAWAGKYSKAIYFQLLEVLLSNIDDIGFLGRENIARILVQSGSKVDYKNAPGYIPLHDAAKHGLENDFK